MTTTVFYLCVILVQREPPPPAELRDSEFPRVAVNAVEHSNCESNQ